MRRHPHGGYDDVWRDPMKLSRLGLHLRWVRMPCVRSDMRVPPELVALPAGGVDGVPTAAGRAVIVPAAPPTGIPRRVVVAVRALFGIA